jgi:hypothetical protein
MQNTIVSPQSPAGRITVWVPPAVSNELLDRNVKQMLYSTLSDAFQGGTFDRDAGLELKFKTRAPDGRRRIIAGLKRHGIRTQ